MRFHINPANGNVGPCKAMVQCPFGDLETDHYETAEKARAAYEKSMAPKINPHVDPNADYTRWRRGKKMSTRNLKDLPEGATVSRPSFHWVPAKPDGMEYVQKFTDYVKRGNYWYSVGGEDDARAVESMYLGGAAGNQPSTLVSIHGESSESLGSLEPAKPRAKPEPKFGIVSVSNVSSEVYLDFEFTRESQAKKKFAELTRYDQLHSHYELLPIGEARARATKVRA